MSIVHGIAFASEIKKELHEVSRESNQCIYQGETG